MDALLSPYLIAPALAWLVAQGLKYLIASIKGRHFSSLRQMYLSGSMPSAHSASVIALLMVVGLRDGTGSAVFGIAALFAAVVMYDAVMVRRSSGEQGTALRWLFHKLQLTPESPFRTAKGHTPKEVIGGAIVGIAVGMFVFFALVH